MRQDDRLADRIAKRDQRLGRQEEDEEDAQEKHEDDGKEGQEKQEDEREKAQEEHEEDEKDSQEKDEETGTPPIFTDEGMEADSDGDDKVPEPKRRKTTTASSSGINYFCNLIGDSKDATKKRPKVIDVTDKFIRVIEEQKASPNEEEDEWMKWLYDDVDFVDDVNGGKELDKERVIKARKAEMDYFKKRGVYTKVPRSEATKGGHKIITTKWIDTEKGSGEYRSRLVGREIKKDQRLDMFAATPPIETMRFLASQCAQRQGQSKPWRMGVIDVRRAYFYAPATRPIYVEIPVEDREDGDEDVVGRLQMSLYGTRDAAMNWTVEYSTYLRQLGFKQGTASPCNFRHSKLDLNTTVHGDDFLMAGPLNSLKWLVSKMRAKYEIKSHLLGPAEEDCEQEILVLGRKLRWTSKGIEYEADEKHARLIIEALGLDSARLVSTPGSNEEKVTVERPKRSSKQKKQQQMQECFDDFGNKYANPGGDVVEEILMDPVEARRYRAIVARLNYLATDRPDLQYATKECCKRMARPMCADWARLKRVGRYLKGYGRLIQLLPWEARKFEFVGHADSDWAGDKVTMKSTSGGAIYSGQSLIKSWSCNQSVIALSSGEAELYALTRLATQTVGIMSMAADFDCPMRGRIKSDSSAAIAISSRNGLGGKSRHIRVQYLWIQEALREESLTLQKIQTSNNTADLLTKHLGREPFWKHVSAMGFSVGFVASAGPAGEHPRRGNRISPCNRASSLTGKLLMFYSLRS